MANGRVFLNKSVALGDGFMMTYFEITDLKRREEELRLFDRV